MRFWDNRCPSKRQTQNSRDFPLWFYSNLLRAGELGLCQQADEAKNGGGHDEPPDILLHKSTDGAEIQEVEVESSELEFEKYQIPHESAHDERTTKRGEDDEQRFAHGEHHKAKEKAGYGLDDQQG